MHIKSRINMQCTAHRRGGRGKKKERRREKSERWGGGIEKEREREACHYKIDRPGNFAIVRSPKAA
jgi:hypothetical protein